MAVKKRTSLASKEQDSSDGSDGTDGGSGSDGGGGDSNSGDPPPTIYRVIFLVVLFAASYCTKEALAAGSALLEYDFDRVEWIMSKVQANAASEGRGGRCGLSQLERNAASESLIGRLESIAARVPPSTEGLTFGTSRGEKKGLISSYSYDPPPPPPPPITPPPSPTPQPQAKVLLGGIRSNFYMVLWTIGSNLSCGTSPGELTRGECSATLPAGGITIGQTTPGTFHSRSSVC